MPDWSRQAQASLAAHGSVVIVTVAGVRGSAPRAPGSKMVVDVATRHGSIGGGNLEYVCERAARTLLADTALPAHLERRFVLGSQCGQCCGGVVDVVFERLTADDADWLVVLPAGTGQWLASGLSGPLAGQRLLLDGGGRIVRELTVAASADAVPQRWPMPPGATLQVVTSPAGASSQCLVEPLQAPALSVMLFGAGHVGRACATILGLQDARVVVVDSRPEYLSEDWPTNTDAVLARDPVAMVHHAAANTFFLVMTHDHAVDLALVRAILTQTDASYCGLIGSRSKRRRFEKRLRALGVTAAALQRLVCPIGIDTIGGKLPGQIALAVIAEIVILQQQRERRGQLESVSLGSRRASR